MIRHFLERDFRTFRTAWFMLLGLLTVSWTLSQWAPVSHSHAAFAFSQFLLMTGFFFSMVPAQYLVGTRMRTQVSLSRAYLLSLPIPKKKLYALTLLRFLPYQLPLGVGALLFIMTGPPAAAYSGAIGWGRSLVVLAIGGFWFMNFVVWQMVEMEKVLLIPFARDRFVTRLRLVGWTLGETLVVGAFPITAVQPATRPQTFIFFLGLAMSAAIHRFFVARRSWLNWD